MEQAVADLPHVSRAQRVEFEALTDFAAEAFCGVWRGDGAASVRHALSRFEAGLPAVDPDARTVTIRIPEGFAFYALYPEQYAAAAERWLHDHRDTTDRTAVIVGIRTIGTTLSAVATAVLRRAAWKVRRVTVRPGGHPYARQTALSPGDIGRPAWGLVVDEGPGQSGSSMAAAAEALARVGVEPRRIAFFPGHPGEPGECATADVGRWWAAVPRYCVPTGDLRWSGRTLQEVLAAEALDYLAVPVQQTEDHGGGLWRRTAFASEAAWPPACPPFERPKYRCVDAAGRAIVWKFEGLDGFTEQCASAAGVQLAGVNRPPVLGRLAGFAGYPWVEGTRLTRSDASAELTSQIGAYIAAAAGPPLAGVERDAAFERLREMLYWNTWEALGESEAEKTRKWSDRAARALSILEVAAYGDGRLAPHEWLRTPAGTLVKTDYSGHDTDHTVVGRQPVFWDLAGAVVEWRLEDALPLLDGYAAAGGPECPPLLHTYYRMAFAAFRIGITTLSAAMSGHDPHEQQRLERARGGYQEYLTGLLGR